MLCIRQYICWTCNGKLVLDVGKLTCTVRIFISDAHLVFAYMANGTAHVTAQKAIAILTPSNQVCCIMTQAAKQLVNSSLRRAEKNSDIIMEGTHTGQVSKITKHL